MIALNGQVIDRDGEEIGLDYESCYREWERRGRVGTVAQIVEEHRLKMKVKVTADELDEAIATDRAKAQRLLDRANAAEQQKTFRVVSAERRATEAERIRANIAHAEAICADAQDLIEHNLLCAVFSGEHPRLGWNGIEGATYIGRDLAAAREIISGFEVWKSAQEQRLAELEKSTKE